MDRRLWRVGFIPLVLAAPLLVAPVLVTIEVTGPVMADEASPSVRELLALPGLDAIDLSWRTPDHANASAITAYEFDLVSGGVRVTGYPKVFTVEALREYEKVDFGDDGPIGGTDETPTGEVPDDELTQPDLFSVVLTGLVTGTSYDVTITPVGGQVQWGAATVQQTPRHAPGPATNLVVIPSETTITASWDAPAEDGGSNITGYLVQVEPSSGGTLNVTGTEVTISGLNPETRTTVSLVAVNALGESVPVIATTRTLAPVGMAQIGGVAATTSGTTTTLRAPLFDNGRPASVQQVGFLLSRTDPPLLDANGTTFVPAVQPPAGNGTLTATTDLPNSGELWFLRAVLKADYTGATGKISYGPTVPYSVSDRTIRFTNAGQSGSLGPVQQQADGFYSSGQGGTFTHRVEIRPEERGIQRYLVDLPGAYRMEAAGAAGGNATAPSGTRGAVVSGTFVFGQGDPLMVVVGQRASHRVGGGGGTFLTAGTDLALAEPLLVAGGGGGGGRDSVPSRAHGRAPDPGALESPGQDAGMLTCQALVACGSGAGRTGGLGGRVQETSSDPHGLFGTSIAAAGGGLISEGATGYSRHRSILTNSRFFVGTQGRAFRSGAAGGNILRRVATGNSDVRQYRLEGGFGGAGTGYDELPPGGGGGGYNGGGGGLMDAIFYYSRDNQSRDQNAYGGGGGSFNAGSAPDGASGANSGVGYLEMRLLATVPVAGSTSITGARAGAQATFSSHVLSTGGDVAIERGFVLSQHPDATLDAPEVVRIIATGQGEGSFGASSPTLPPRTFLYVRSYVSGFGGVGYGPVTALATFRPYEFTTAGVAGPVGPAQSALNTEYAGTPLAGLVTTSLSAGVPQGVQRFVVPVTGRYRIQALGARGGVRTPPGFNTPRGGDLGGRAAAVEGTFELSQGDQLLIVVGQQPGNPVGGGGGSFVVSGSAINDPNLEPLLIAGGGGAVSFPFDTFPESADATAPLASQISSETRSVGDLGGTGGQGGRTVAPGGEGTGIGGLMGQGTGGGSRENRGWAGAGGGLLSSGEDGLDILNTGETAGVTDSGGRGFLQGAEGGRGRTYQSGVTTDGGFGGGGAGSAAFFNGWSQGGSGGGYNGAGATEPLAMDQYPRIGRGGGSYNAGTARTDLDGINLGDGRVVVTLIPPPQPNPLLAGSGAPRSLNVTGTTVERPVGSVLAWRNGTLVQVETIAPANTTTSARTFIDSTVGSEAGGLLLDVVDGSTGAEVIGLLTERDSDEPLPVPSGAITGVTTSAETGEIRMLLTGTDDQDQVSLRGSNDEPVAGAGGRISTILTGLPPGSEGEVSLRSEPRLLGRFTVNADGVAAFVADVPTDIAPGAHTLVVATFSGDQQTEAVVSLGITVRPRSSTGSPQTSTSPPTGTAPETRPTPVPPGPLAPGDSSVTENGVAIPIDVTREDSGGILLRGPDFDLRLGDNCAPVCTVELDPSGRPLLRLDSSASLDLNGGGFLAGSTVYVWMFSDPTFLGELTVDANGRFSGEVSLAGITPGDHILQITGTNPDGNQRSINLGVSVESAPSTTAPGLGLLPVTGGGWNLLLWMVLLIAMGLLTLGTRRRFLSQL